MLLSMLACNEFRRSLDPIITNRKNCLRMLSAPAFAMEDPEQAGDLVRPTLEDRVTRRMMDYSENDIENLGRKRPAVFKNMFMEVGFCLSILASNLVSVRLFHYPFPFPIGIQPRAGASHVAAARCLF